MKKKCIEIQHIHVGDPLLAYIYVEQNQPLEQGKKKNEKEIQKTM